MVARAVRCRSDASAHTRPKRVAGAWRHRRAVGVTYGGNGTTTFALPDLSGRTVRSVGPNHPLGARIGEDTVQLTVPQMPSHAHGLTAP